MSRLRALPVALLICAALAGGALLMSGSSGTPQSATGSVHPSGWGSTPKGFTLPKLRLTAVPTAEQYDAVTLSNIPAHPFAVAGYTAGRYLTWLSLLRDFPSAHHISIAIQARYHAMCLDVEPGDAVPSQAGAWVRADIAVGFPRPCIYSDLSEMPAVRSSLTAAGLKRSQYLLWLAWYRGVPGLVSDYDAVQWTDHALGRSLDESTVTLDFLRIATPPYVPPVVLPVCFHVRERVQTCTAAKAKIASQERAAASSQRAYIARGCPGISQRRSWFASHVNKPPATKHAYRARALAASRAAYRRESCGTFSQRSSYFQAAAAKVQEAN